MSKKKFIISLLAFLAMASAIYGVWRWQKKVDDLPQRQTQEIRANNELQ